MPANGAHRRFIAEHVGRLPVDEERRRAPSAKIERRLHIPLHIRLETPRIQATGERLAVQLQLGRILLQVRRCQPAGPRLLVEKIVVLSEGILLSRALRRFGGLRRLARNHREVAKRKADLLPELRPQPLLDAAVMPCPAGRAREIAELDHAHRRIGRPDDVRRRNLLRLGRILPVSRDAES